MVEHSETEKTNRRTSSEEQLALIRNMMERSTRFVSISGLSILLAGCYALIGALIAYLMIFRHHRWWNEYFHPLDNNAVIDLRLQILGLGILILVLSLGTISLLSARKARRMGLSIWSKQTRHIAYQLAVPLATGGLFCLLLIWRNDISLIASACLMFYGLALLNTSKFTFVEVHYLALAEIVLGLISGLFLNYGLFFWAIGFGAFHFILGMLVYLRYDKKEK